MTEEEWLADEGDLGPLLRVLLGTGTAMPSGFSSSARKERLFAVACSHSELVQDEQLCIAIGVLERCADGLATEDEVQMAREGASEMPSGPQKDLALAILGLGESSHLGTVLHYAERLEMAHLPGDPLRNVNLPAHRKIWRIQANVLRHIFGNPFRPIVFSPKWRSDIALSIAQQMYAARDFSLMPILADALQDASCDSADILDHCRGSGPHMRGCWAVDILLGKK
jgi:hypothetical protein